MSRYKRKTRDEVPETVRFLVQQLYEKVADEDDSALRFYATSRSLFISIYATSEHSVASMLRRSSAFLRREGVPFTRQKNDPDGGRAPTIRIGYEDIPEESEELDAQEMGLVLADAVYRSRRQGMTKQELENLLFSHRSDVSPTVMAMLLQNEGLVSALSEQGAVWYAPEFAPRGVRS